MLLSTMTYEQIYREIVKDYHDLSAAFMKEVAGFQKLAKKAKRYPFRKIYQWKHPISFNQYTYFFETKRHSDWDKDPRLVIYVVYEAKEGKTTIAIARYPYNNIRIHVMGPHFLERYLERNALLDAQSTQNVLMEFFCRTSSAIPLGEKVVSLKELQKEEPGLINESLLTTEGIILCKQVRANLNIWIFKTFIGGKEFHDNQYKEATLKALDLFWFRAMNDSPRFGQSITKIYEDGINELNKLWLDSELPFEEKQELRMKKWEEAIAELYKYCN